eukprot:gene4219-4634_t
MSDAEEELIEEISEEEKLQIAQHYLLSSPPGQFNEILADVRKIIPEKIIPDSVAAGIARAANIKTGKVVTTPSGRKAVLTTVGEVDASHYYDPSSKATFAVDHLTLTTREDSLPYPSDESLEVLRQELQLVSETYVKANYLAEQSAAGVFARDGVISILVSGEKVNLRSFWSGRWTSTWAVAKTSANAVTLTGEIKIHVHYFEDGNLQMQSTKIIPTQTLEYSTESDLAKVIFERIRAEENALQGGLEDVYGNMNSETIRSMRRIMPITKSKMEWNVNAVRLTRQMRK